MTNLPDELQLSIEAALGTRLQNAIPLEGGMICRALRLRTSDGDLFLKWHPAAPTGFFEAEARGLELLRSANALRVPGCWPGAKLKPTHRHGWLWNGWTR